MHTSRLMMTLMLTSVLGGCSLMQTAKSLPEAPQCPTMRPVTFEIYEPGTKINELKGRVYGLDEEEIRRLLHYLVDLEAVAGCSP